MTKHWVFIRLFENRIFTNIQTLLGFQSNYWHRQAFLLGVLSAILELTMDSSWSRGRAERMRRQVRREHEKWQKQKEQSRNLNSVPHGSSNEAKNSCLHSNWLRSLAQGGLVLISPTLAPPFLLPHVVLEKKKKKSKDTNHLECQFEWFCWQTPCIKPSRLLWLWQI